VLTLAQAAVGAAMPLAGKSPTQLASDGLASAPKTMSDEHLKPGFTLDHYAILSLIGSGGMGDVYLCDDDQTGRRVAVKVLRKDALDRHDFVKRVRQEARILASLNHPNIVTLYGVGVTQDHGHHLIVMEYLDGKSLAKLIRHYGKLRPRDALSYAYQAAKGLQHAHYYGVVHRDIKPENMMILRTGELKLLDYGIAKVLGQTFTSGGSALLGTPAYAAPEQIRGLEVTTATDVYSLCMSVYEALSGRYPYSLEEGFFPSREIAQQNHLAAEAISLFGEVVGVSQALSDGLLAGLSKDPKKRPSAKNLRRLFFRERQNLPVNEQTTHAPLARRDDEDDEDDEDQIAGPDLVSGLEPEGNAKSVMMRLEGGVATFTGDEESPALVTTVPANDQHPGVPNASVFVQGSVHASPRAAADADASTAANATTAPVSATAFAPTEPTPPDLAPTEKRVTPAPLPAMPAAHLDGHQPGTVSKSTQLMFQMTVAEARAFYERKQAESAGKVDAEEAARTRAEAERVEAARIEAARAEEEEARAEQEERARVEAERSRKAAEAEAAKVDALAAARGKWNEPAPDTSKESERAYARLREEYREAELARRRKQEEAIEAAKAAPAAPATTPARSPAPPVTDVDAGGSSPYRYTPPPDLLRSATTPTPAASASRFAPWTPSAPPTGRRLRTAKLQGIDDTPSNEPSATSNASSGDRSKMSKSSAAAADQPGADLDDERFPVKAVAWGVSVAALITLIVGGAYYVHTSPTATAATAATAASAASADSVATAAMQPPVPPVDATPPVTTATANPSGSASTPAGKPSVAPRATARPAPPHASAKAKGLKPLVE
jgi:serine/threonine-protein kinase